MSAELPMEWASTRSQRAQLGTPEGQVELFGTEYPSASAGHRTGRTADGPPPTTH